MVEQEIEIAFNNRVAHNTLLMGFRSPEIASESRPGQFIMIRVRAGMDPLLRRPFSICGIREKDLICILYRVMGTGTAIMAQTGKGDRLSVTGPLGRGFDPFYNDRRSLLIAGGIGVAPLLYLAQEIKNSGMVFMAGFRSAGEGIDPVRIGYPGIRISFATDDGSKGYAGLVTGLLEEYLEKSMAVKEPFAIYACGPPPMLKKLVSVAAVNKIPCQVCLESAMACGIGACQGCAVKKASGEGQGPYYHVCRDGPVFDSHRIDWSRL